jgi:hypothetical protein
VRIPTTPDRLPDLVAAREAALKRGLRDAAHLAAAHGQALLVRVTPVDTGMLKASWDVTRYEVAPDLLATLANSAPYAGILEHGARPHMVSPEGWLGIYEWVRRHRKLFGFVGQSGRARKPKVGTKVVHKGLTDGGVGLDPVLAGITWAIAKKIAKEGRRPTYFVRDRLPQLTAYAAGEVRRMANRLAETKVPR